MIASVRGTILEKQPTRLVVETGGVGLEILAPLPTTQEAGAPGDAIHLHTVLIVREDALTLYGFLDAESRALFLRLISVSGIGPRIALNALSGAAPADLVGAIRRGDLGRLTRLPGIGRKTAERLVLELKDTAATWGAGGETGGAGVEGDAAAALVSLGYSAVVAAKAAHEAAERLGDGAEAGRILRGALAALTGAASSRPARGD